MTATKTVTVSGPVISTQPTDKTYCPGAGTSTLIFTVADNGGNTYQWKRSTTAGNVLDAPNAGGATDGSGSGATTNTYTYVAGNASSTFKFEVVLTGGRVYDHIECRHDHEQLPARPRDHHQQREPAPVTPVGDDTSRSSSRTLPRIRQSAARRPTSGSLSRRTPRSSRWRRRQGWACPTTSTGAATTNGITSIAVTAAGTGYSSATATVTVAAPTSGVTALAVPTVVGGNITAITVIDPAAQHLDSHRDGQRRHRRDRHRSDSRRRTPLHDHQHVRIERDKRLVHICREGRSVRRGQLDHQRHRSACTTANDGNTAAFLATSANNVSIATATVQRRIDAHVEGRQRLCGLARRLHALRKSRHLPRQSSDSADDGVDGQRRERRPIARVEPRRRRRDAVRLHLQQ